MNPDRWREVKAVCHEALARAPAEREAFLDTACSGDAELRREVESLLAEQSGAEEFLATGTWRRPALAPGTKLGPHEILELIGEGGMGQVYKARDTRLDRVVALKILPPEVSSDPERRTRFAREAKTISQLNHPHICTLHDIGEARLRPSGFGEASSSPESLIPSPVSVSYLVMEFLEGETLADRLRQGPLPVPLALEAGAQIAEALDVAHGHGIIHRDLKPGNVMLTANGVKLLDFGLAKLRGSETRAPEDTSTPTATASLTQAGEVLGTRPYMAPEQVEGRRADARTDVWALGCVLYEMFTGRPAFSGESIASLTAAILDREPEPLTKLQPLVPTALEHVVQTCLAKNPDARWQTAADVGRHLGEIAARAEPGGPRTRERRRAVRLTVAAVGAVCLIAVLVGFNIGSMRDYLAGRGNPEVLRSVAVLPLVNLTGHPDQQVQVDGITDMIGTELGTVGALTVKAGPSMKQVDIARPIPDIARQLDVDAILAGSVHRVDERVAVSLRLVQASPERVRWARNFETPAAEVLNLPKLVAQAVAEGAAAPLSPEQQQRLASSRTVNEKAWYLVDRARWSLLSLGQDYRQRIQWLEEAIALEPSWALPHARLADEFVHAAVTGLIYPPGEAYTEARRHAEQALQLDPRLAETHAAMALVKLVADWDWREADALFRTAVDLNPSSTSTLNWYGWYLIAADRFDEGVRQYQRIQDLDPLGQAVNWEWVYFVVGRYDDAVAAFRAHIAANRQLAGEPWLLVWVALAQVGRGDLGSATTACDELLRSVDKREEPFFFAACAFVFGSAGNRARALEMGRRLEALERQGRLADPCMWAVLEAGLGDRDRAFVRLDQAWRERSPNIVGLETDGLLLFRSLRTDPRYQQLLRRINHPRSTPADDKVAGRDSG